MAKVKKACCNQSLTGAHLDYNIELRGHLCVYIVVLYCLADPSPIHPQPPLPFELVEVLKWTRNVFRTGLPASTMIEGTDSANQPTDYFAQFCTGVYSIRTRMSSSIHLEQGGRLFSRSFCRSVRFVPFRLAVCPSVAPRSHLLIYTLRTSLAAAAVFVV